MVYKEHWHFTPPENRQVPIWRYLDLPRFLSMLHREALHFTRPDQFDDPFEGAGVVRAPKCRDRDTRIQARGRDQVLSVDADAERRELLVHG
jgi:hypothetical protein